MDRYTHALRLLQEQCGVLKTVPDKGELGMDRPG